MNHSVYMILTIKYDARTPFLSGEIYYFHVTLLTDSRRGVSAISYVRSSRRRHATLVCDIRFSDNNTSIYRTQKYQIPTDANRGQYTLLRDVFYILINYNYYETNRSVPPTYFLVMFFHVFRACEFYTTIMHQHTVFIYYLKLRLSTLSSIHTFVLVILNGAR